MSKRFPWCCGSACWIVASAVIAWAVLFPEDVQTILTPVELVLHALPREVYLLIAVAMVCRTYQLSRRPTAPPPSLPGPKLSETEPR